MIEGLRPVAQNIKNLAKVDNDAVERNLEIIKELENRIRNLKNTNVFLAERAADYNLAHQTLCQLRSPK